MTKNKLYTILAVACFFGFVWLGFAYVFGEFLLRNQLHVCIFKNLTGYPCPACGTTRSVKLLLFDGDIWGAFLMNPLGIVVSGIMIAVPFWLLYDGMSKRQTFFNAYVKAEKIITTKWILLLLIALLVLNWIWNLNKQL